jgi:hypothetical protein
MQILVLTNAKGEVIGTARQAVSHISVGITPREGQKVHKLEVPDNLAEFRGEALHAKLADHLREYLRAK